MAVDEEGFAGGPAKIWRAHFTSAPLGTKVGEFTFYRRLSQ